MSVSPHARQIMSIGNTESQKKGAHKETQIQCRVSTAAQMHVDRRCRVVFGVRWRPKWSVVQSTSLRFQWCQFVVRFISGNSNSELRLEARRRLTE